MNDVRGDDSMMFNGVSCLDFTGYRKMTKCYELIKHNFDGQQFARLFLDFKDAVHEAEDDMRYEFIDKCTKWDDKNWKFLKINPNASEIYIMLMSEHLEKFKWAKGLWRDEYYILERSIK